MTASTRTFILPVSVLLVLAVGCGAPTQQSGASSTLVTDTSSPLVDDGLSTTTEGTPEVPDIGADSVGITGTVVIGVVGSTARYALTAVPSGSYRFVDDSDGDVVGFDAGGLSFWVASAGVGWVNDNHPPGGPDSKVGNLARDITWEQIWIAALGRSRSGSGDELTWTMTEAGDPEFGDVAEVQCSVWARIDPQTKLLLEGRKECGKQPIRTYELVDLDPLAIIDPSLFILPTDLDKTNLVSDQGFIHTTLDEARAMASYPLPVPELPVGYVLADVVYSSHAADSPMEYSDMPSNDVVVMVFRDGFQTVTVTTRAFVATRELGDGSTVAVRWSPWGGVDSGPAEISFDGAIDGDTVTFSADRDGPAWAATNDVVITVDGALSEAELADVLTSFSTG